jgi:hypothetical protein
MDVRPHRRAPLDFGLGRPERAVCPAPTPSDDHVPAPAEMLEELALVLACFLAVALAGNLLVLALGS